MAAVRLEVGRDSLARRLEDIIYENDGIVCCRSMSSVVLMYAWRFCTTRAGEAIGFGGPSLGEPPGWTGRPWSKHGLLSRLKIRLGRIP